MRNGKPNIRHDVDVIKDDIATLQSDLTTALKDLVAAGASEAGDIRERVETELRQKLARLSDRADELARRGKRAVEGVEGMIEEKPIQAVGIALGVGVLVGVLLSRK
jgi:ElaB/YqjD/DUF883 family membrane-anchored ribosome-binding protein